jgi:endonuclease III
VWLILKLQEKGLTVQTSELSYVLSGVMVTPKAKRVLQACDEILKEFEGEVESND